MNINFSLCGSETIKEDFENFLKFKDRYISIISGRRTVNDDENELERLGILLDMQMILENLLCDLETAEAEETQIKNNSIT